MKMALQVGHVVLVLGIAVLVMFVLVYQETHGSGYDDLNHPLQECRNQQRNSAGYLREISANVRKQQKMLNTKKLWLSSAGLLAALVDIVGLILGPTTATCPAVAGRVAGVSLGVRDIYTSYDEINIDANAIDEVRDILGQLGQVTTKLTKELEIELESHGFSSNDIMKFGIKGGFTLKGAWSLIGSLNTVRAVAKASTEAEKFAVVLAAQESGLLMSLIDMIGLDKKTHGKVCTCVIYSVNVVFKLKAIIETTWKIRSDASEVADAIDVIASVLERN